MMLRRLLPLLLFQCMLYASDVPQSQVLHADELHAAGVGRLGDVFPLLLDGSFRTLDGFRTYSVPRTFNTGPHCHWICYMDGRRLDMNFAGDYSINLLPLNPDQIDSIKIISRPVFENAEYSGTGIIHIFSKDHSPGIYAHAKYYHGNETGDPGPYLYTSLKSGNVDQQGPDYSASFGWAGKRLGLSAGAATLRHTSTDPAIRQRHRGQPWRFLRPQASILYATLNMRFEQWQHKFFAGQGASGAPWLIEDYGAELFRLPFTGRELFVESRYRHAGLSGHKTGPQSSKTGYHLKWARSRTVKPPGYEGPDLDWHLHSISGHFCSDFNFSHIRTTLGYGFQRHFLQSRFVTDRPMFKRENIYAHVNTRVCRLQPSLEIGIRFQNNTPALLLNSGIQWRPGPRTLAGIQISRGPHGPLENDLNWWHANGYRPAIDYLADSHPGQYAVTTAMMYYRLLSRANMLFEAGVKLQEVNGRGRVKRSRDRHVRSAWLKYRVQYHQKLKTVVYISLFDTPIQILHFIPAYQVKLLSHFTPVKSFSIWSMASYVSDTFRPAGFYDETAELPHALSDLFVVDLTLKKSFWHHRFAASFIFRNLFDRPYKTHPEGARFDLALYILVEFDMHKKLSSKF